MPAVSEKQKNLMCIALAIKLGKQPESDSEEAARLAKTMSEEELRDFCESSSDEAMNKERYPTMK